MAVFNQTKCNQVKPLHRGFTPSFHQYFLIVPALSWQSVSVFPGSDSLQFQHFHILSLLPAQAKIIQLTQLPPGIFNANSFVVKLTFSF